MELPPDFIHEPPTDYTYEVLPFKRNVLSIWCCNHRQFTFNGGAVAKTIWGFYDTRKHTYFAPVNSKQPGTEVSINETTPYSAMKLNRKGLECLWM